MTRPLVLSSSSWSWDYTRGISRAWCSRRYQSIDRTFGSFFTHRFPSLFGRDLMMIVFDPAIFRLPVLRRRYARKLKQQEITVRDGRGSQWAGLGGWGIRRSSNRLRLANERTAFGAKMIPRKNRRCTHTEQIRRRASSTRLLPCRTRRGTSNGFVQR
jgi:hypothetical protein